MGREILIGHQAQDGSWTEDGGYPSQHPVLNTAFALMFLKRANLTPDLSRRLTVDVAALTSKVDDKVSPKPVTPPPTKTEPPPVVPEVPPPTPKVEVPPKTTPAPAPPVVATAPTTTTPVEKSSNGWIWIVLLIVLALAGGGIAFFAMRRGNEADEDEEKPKKKKKGERSGYGWKSMRTSSAYSHSSNTRTVSLAEYSTVTASPVIVSG